MSSAVSGCLQEKQESGSALKTDENNKNRPKLVKIVFTVLREVLVKRNSEQIRIIKKIVFKEECESELF